MPRGLFSGRATIFNGALISVSLLFGLLPASALELDTQTCNLLTPVDLRITKCSDLISGKDAGNQEALFYDYRTRGLSFFSRRHYARALADYNEALRLRPNWAGSTFSMGSAEVYALRAELWLAKSDKGRAMADLDQAIRIGQPVPEKGRFYAKRADLWADKSNFDRAVADFNAAIPLLSRSIYDSTLLECYFKRAGLFERMGNRERARADYKAAVSIKLSDSEDQKYRSLQATARSKLASLAAEDATQTGAAPTPPAPPSQRTSSWLPNMWSLAPENDYTGSHATSPTQCRDACIRNSGCFGWYMNPSDPSSCVLNKKPVQILSKEGSIAGVITTEAGSGLAPGMAEPQVASPSLSPVIAAAPAATGPAVAPSSAAPATAFGHRVALVIGNGDYRFAPKLGNPTNDAADIAASLRKLGFDVVTGIDLDRRAFDDTIREFGRKLDRADLALFFYAGHGLQVGGKNYLVPIDAKLERAGDLALDAVDVGTVLAQMEAEKRVNLVFLDACRDNPLARSLARSLGTRSASVGQGLATIQSAIGTMIAYSTQPDNVALDGDGRNSPFVAALLKHVGDPGTDISVVMRRVRSDVIAATHEKQVPWDHSSLTGEVILAR